MIPNDSQQFSDEAKRAIDLIQQKDKNVFITGKAGTGKSTLLEYIRMIPGHKMIVLAPTGIAAIHVKGETIHSFFKLKPGYELEEAKNMRMDSKRAKAYQAIQTILIDEISMVRADILDAIHVFLQRARKSDLAFGGVQMIFFGDLFQLPPVVTKEDKEAFYKNYTSPYFFSANVFRPQNLFTEAFQMEKVELTKIYRQKDEKFIHILNAIRENTASQEDLDFLNQRSNPYYTAPKHLSCIHLMATNAKANSMNYDKLSEIANAPISFKANKNGKIGNLQPNDATITVKVAAQVMFINNDFKKRWVNGTIGKVVSHKKVFDEEIGKQVDALEVLLENDKTVEVRPHTWELSKYSFKEGKFMREQIGHFTQIPLKLAWAITIHKSQGKTFDNVVIDLGWGSFAHGQTYVALSRCTSLEGLVLKQDLRKSDIIVDEAVRNFRF